MQQCNQTPVRGTLATLVRPGVVHTGGYNESEHRFAFPNHTIEMLIYTTCLVLREREPMFRNFPRGEKMLAGVVPCTGCTGR